MQGKIVKLIKYSPFIFVGIIILLIVLFSSFYTVDESEQAVIETFGKANDTITDAGFHVKYPWPIQSVTILEKKPL